MPRADATTPPPPLATATPYLPPTAASYLPPTAAPYLPPTASPAAPETDPLLPTGIALAVAGALEMLGGAVAYGAGASAGEELCGLSGCVSRPDANLQVGGLGLLSSGGLLLAMSIPVIAVGATGDTPVRANDLVRVAFNQITVGG
jgi:hypothetical protein